MREIKFRAWDKEREMMIMEPYFFGLDAEQDFKGYYYLEDALSHENGESYPCDIMQYTGLKDKNGKEIFEGDVVEWETPSQYPQRDTVVFGDGMFMLKEDEESVFNYIYCKYNIEVIGNIHENPELLENAS